VPGPTAPAFFFARRSSRMSGVPIRGESLQGSGGRVNGRTRPFLLTPFPLPRPRHGAGSFPVTDHRRPSGVEFRSEHPGERKGRGEARPGQVPTRRALGSARTRECGDYRFKNSVAVFSADSRMDDPPFVPLMFGRCRRPASTVFPDQRFVIYGFMDSFEGCITLRDRSKGSV
jgi:hypothetical protein